MRTFDREEGNLHRLGVLGEAVGCVALVGVEVRHGNSCDVLDMDALGSHDLVLVEGLEGEHGAAPHVSFHI